MSFFQNIIKDLSEIGSPIAILRGRLASISKLLSDYSFGETNYSKEITHTKIIAQFNDAFDASKKCKPGDVIRLYFERETVEVNPGVAMRAAQFWIDAVMDMDKTFTASLAIQLIDRAKSDFVNVDKVYSKKQEVNLGNLLPNFIQFMTDVSSIMESCNLITDSPHLIEYRAPILSFGRTMGYNHFTVHNLPNGGYAFRLIAKGIKGQKVESHSEIFQSDLLVDQYNDLLNTIAQEVMLNPIYQGIATG